MAGYLKKFIPFAVLIALVLYILGFATDFKTAMPFAWVCYGVFFVISIVTYYFSSITMKKRLGSFIGVFFTGIFSKLVIAAVVVMIFKAGNDTTDVSYIVPFAIIYFSFLLFETIELVKLSRKAGAPEKKTNHPDKPAA